MPIIPFATRRPAPAAAPAPASIRLAEVLSALTYALDLTEGQRPGHTLRTALIAMRMGREIGLESRLLGALYYAALLKDSGCSSNAARMAALFGSNDHTVKREMRLVDWHDKWRLAMRTAQNCGVGRNPIARLQHFLRIAGTPHMTREIIQARCERGAQIAVWLGFPPETAEAIAHVDEHWCGLGHPVGLAGDEIPLLSRMLLLAQTIEAFYTEHGIDAAMAMARGRRGKWFDPALVDAVCGWRRDRAWWASIADLDRLDASVIAQEPGDVPESATDERLDAISRAFAAVIDAKTPFTYRHSRNVAHYACAIGDAVGVDATARRDLLRAGLLHDIGKLGISNTILDKPSRLTDAERSEIMKHPVWTSHILERVPAFQHFAAASSYHHERIDGSGYPWGLSGAKLDATARTLAVADVYEALTANRPYRGPMPVSTVLDIMQRDRGTAFDAGILDAAIALAEAGVFATIAEDSSDDIDRVPTGTAVPLLSARSAA